jgi:long-chain fatty acid transport protein
LRSSRASIVAWCLLSAEPALGTPSALFGPGPRSQALGGTGAATPDTVEAAATNPAALGGERPEAVLGYRATHFELRAEPLPDTRAALGAGLFGVTLPLLRGERYGLTLGMLAATPNELVVSAELPPADEPQFPLLLERARALDLALGLGFRFRELGVGLGLRALAGLDGHARVVDESGRTRAEVADTLDPVAAPVLGAFFEASPVDRLALVGRAALSAEFDVAVDVAALGSVTLPELAIGGVAHYDPAELHAEWRRAFGRRGTTRAALALTYRRWSAFPGWLSQTVVCKAPDCTASPKERVSLSDTLVPRLGLEQALELGSATVSLRAGYFYEASPLEEQRSAANRFDDARHAFGLGYGLELERFSLDLGYQLQVLVPREHVKGAAVAPDNPGFPRVRSEGEVHVLSIAIGGAL